MTRPLPLSEADFQRRVMDAAKLSGFMVAHFRPALNRSGRWATPMQGDKGFPDLVLAKAGRVVVAELKSESGRPTLEQRAWLEAFGDHGRLWKPSDWPAVMAELGVS